MRIPLPHALPFMPALPAAAMAAYSMLTVEDPETETLATEVALAEDDEEIAVPTHARWGGPIGMEEETTGDGRRILANALRWSDDIGEHPLPLRYVAIDNGAHDGAVTVAGIDTLERREGGVIWGEGPMYLDTPEGVAAYKAIKSKRQDGVSMDLDDVSWELQVASDLLGDEEEGLGFLLADGEEPEEREYEKVMEIKSDDELMVTTDARVRGATIVGIPAFADVRISILEEDSDVTDEDETPPGSDELATETEALVASGIPVDPPIQWFRDPKLDGPTPLTIDENGRVYGHLATWGECHSGGPLGAGVCVLVPNSKTGYAKFHTGSLKTQEGQVISIGRLTMNTTHAGPKLSPMATAEHYDHSGRAAADVRAGEDAHGIWVAGALRPGMKPADVRVLRASPLSGDWRRVDGNLELHAVLAVNMPGYAVPRPNGLVASGNLESLVAGGMLAPRRVLRSQLSDDDLHYLRRLADRERTEHKNELAARVALTRNAMKVRAFLAARKIGA